MKPAVHSRQAADTRVKNAIAALCVFIAAALYGCDALAQEGAFYKGNEFYKEGEYDKAIGEYKSVIKSGYNSGNLYYNLGNAYFKKGELGRAILNYERAARLIPRDADLEANYRHARTLMESSALSPPRPWPARFLHNISSRFTVNEITLVLSAAYAAITILLMISVFAREKRRLFVAAACLAVVVGLGGFSLRERARLMGREAVIIEESGEAKFEPFERGTTHFTVYEGMKAEVLQKNDGWRKIRRPDGKIGWVKSSALDII